MKSKHIYLNLFLIDFPFTAITSIIHRISGLMLFLVIPFCLYFFKLSIESESAFETTKIIISQFHIKTIIYIVYLMFLYHLINGIKHMIMDFGFFESKEGSRKLSIASTVLVFIIYILSLII